MPAKPRAGSPRAPPSRPDHLARKKVVSEKRRPRVTGSTWCSSEQENTAAAPVRRAHSDAGIFGKDQLAAVEVVVEDQRHGEGAVGGGGRAVVAMGAEEMAALGAVGQHDVGVEGELALEGEDLDELRADAPGEPVGDGLLHHRLDDGVVLGPLQLGDVDVAVAAGDAAVLVVALVPEADHLGAEVGLEHARQDQHGRHRDAQHLVRPAVGAHRRRGGLHRLGRGRQGAAVEGGGDPLVGIEHDHPHAQPRAALPEADAALGQQRGQELPLGIAQQQRATPASRPAWPRALPRRPACCPRSRPATTDAALQAASRAANWPASR